MNKKHKQYLGWVGAVMVLAGYYLNANEQILSWLIWAIGNSFVGVYCLDKKAYPAAIMSFSLVILNVYGYFSWLEN